MNNKETSDDFDNPEKDQAGNNIDDADLRRSTNDKVDTIL
jgi:hypothetical protein